MAMCTVDVIDIVMLFSLCAGNSSCGLSKPSGFDGAAAHLMKLHHVVEHIASSSGDVALPILQRQLQAFLYSRCHVFHHPCFVQSTYM